MSSQNGIAEEVALDIDMKEESVDAWAKQGHAIADSLTALLTKEGAYEKSENSKFEKGLPQISLCILKALDLSLGEKAYSSNYHNRVPVVDNLVHKYNHLKDVYERKQKEMHLS